jgi:inosose dehydratase
MHPLLFVALAGPLLAPAEKEKPAPPRPIVAAQLYVWTQHYGKKKERLEDHLDDVFAATKRAGYDAVQGFLSFHDTPESAERVAARLKEHKLTMPAAYAGGIMHTRAGGEETVKQIVRQAKNGVPHGLKLVVHNPQPLNREKTDEELALQAENLDRLGAALGKLGVRLAIHSHDPEMRSEAREWYHVLRHTDPAKVGICLDLHWVLRGKQDPYRLLQDAGKRVLDLHLRNSRDGVWSEDLGDGDIDHPRVRKVLEKIGYQGSYTVELAYEGKTPQTRSLEENLRRSREYVRRVLGR